METHLSENDLSRLRRRELPAAEVREALRHLSSCESCSHAAQEAIAADAIRVREVLEDAAEPPAHLSSDELFGWVDGTLDAAARSRAAEHLDECEICREDVADLEPLRRQNRPRRNWIWLAAAAALMTGVFITLLRLPDRTPVPLRVERAQLKQAEAPRYANAEWQRLVDQVRATGRLPFPPDLAELRGESESLRGSSTPATGLWPRGIVIDATRPDFHWPPVAGAAYVVSIFDGENEVMRSEALRVTRWTPSRPLPRGRTYAWQVEATSARGLTILPAPPAPQAKFRIVSARDHDELASAPADDHLLRAALYARAGMEAEALEEFERFAHGSAVPAGSPMTTKPAQ